VLHKTIFFAVFIPRKKMNLVPLSGHEHRMYSQEAF